MHHLLVATSIILKARPVIDADGQFVSVQLKLVETVCEQVLTLERVLEFLATDVDIREMYSQCFRTCSDLLTMLTASIATANSELSFDLKLHKVLKDYGTTLSIARQIAASVPHHENCPLEDFVAASYMAQRMAVSALALFSSLICSFNCDFVSLLVDNELARLLSRVASLTNMLDSLALSRNEVLPYRGYIRTSSQPHHDMPNLKTPFFGYNDPAQEVWKASLKLLSTGLRKASSDTPTGIQMRRIGTTLLKSNAQRVESSLRHCWDSSAEAKSFVLTMNGLEEAGLVLSVGSALCVNKSDSQFKREYSDLFNCLQFHSKQIIASVSSYLGAAASSRELFRAMENDEVAESANGEVANLLQQLHSGVNAKHEAIRYSHFVSGAAVAVSQAESDSATQFFGRWKRSDSRRDSDPQSLPTLEWNCRAAVTSDFSFQLEKAAAECIFFAIHFLWITHPRSSSFIMFSKSEAAKVDSMSLVKPGTIIAFCLNVHSSPTSLLRNNSCSTVGLTRDESLSFGEVLHADTVNRRWRVRSLLKSKDEADVFASELAGIEDVTSRRCVLKYAPAPDNSTDLAVTTPSVGHLILTLRWCHQFQIEENGNGQSMPPSIDSPVARLAELATALLGTELSLHFLIGSQQVPSRPDDPKIIAAQIMDLFGEPSDFEDGEVIGPTRVGRAKNVLGLETWDTIRGQLHRELEQAVKDIELKRGERQRMIENDAWFGGHRSANLSPFRRAGLLSR